MKIDKVPSSIEEVKRELEESYMNALAANQKIAEMLLGKKTPEEEVSRLNRGLDFSMSELVEIRKKAKEKFGLDLPDPFGDSKGFVQ